MEADNNITDLTQVLGFVQLQFILSLQFAHFALQCVNLLLMVFH